MIIATDKNGRKNRVVYNEEVLLMDREDSVSFFVEDVGNEVNFTLNLTFSDKGKEYSTTGDISDDGKFINMTLHKWNNSIATELTKPIALQTKGNKNVWIKFRTAADVKHSFRNVHLTVWIESNDGND